jgi:hypothetical protein
MCAATNAPGPVQNLPRRWQTIGYPIFADFVASSDEFFLLRRFGTLNSRVILGLQDEICKLEASLKELDTSYMNDPEPINNGSFRQEAKEDRKALLNIIKDKLKEYSPSPYFHLT